MTGFEIVQEWERRQQGGRYDSYKESMADLILMIDSSGRTVEPPVVDNQWDYREEQARLRAAGFDAYNCDMVDEFPQW